MNENDYFFKILYALKKLNFAILICFCFKVILTNDMENRYVNLIDIVYNLTVKPDQVTHEQGCQMVEFCSHFYKQTKFTYFHIASRKLRPYYYVLITAIWHEFKTIWQPCSRYATAHFYPLVTKNWILFKSHAQRKINNAVYEINAK